MEDRRLYERNRSLLAGIVIALCSFGPTATRESALADIRPHLKDVRNADVTALCVKAAEADQETLQSARIWAFVGAAQPQSDRANAIARALDIVRKSAFRPKA